MERRHGIFLRWCQSSTAVQEGMPYHSKPPDNGADGLNAPNMFAIVESRSRPTQLSRTLSSRMFRRGKAKNDHVRNSSQPISVTIVAVPFTRKVTSWQQNDGNELVHPGYHAAAEVTMSYYFAIIGTRDNPLFEIDFGTSKGGGDGTAKFREEGKHMNQFIVHAALDMVEEAQWANKEL